MQIIDMHTYCSILLLIVLFKNAVARTQFLSTYAQRISEALPDISVPPIPFPTKPGNCLRLQCKYICFNGKSTNIEDDVYAVENTECEFIDELHLYNYDFQRKTIPRQFLGDIANYVRHISIYASNVESIENGAFKSETLSGIHLENLQLDDIHKGIFESVSERFVSFSLIQKETSLEQVDECFLDDIKYQIKKLTIETGLKTVKNLTNSNCLLNNLEDVDLSYNSFGDRLCASSFSQLSMVEKLNLSNSEISYLPEMIFSDMMSTLTSLDLRNNKLVTINHYIFGWRELRRTLVIYLNGNPWMCQCELRTEMAIILAFQTEVVYCGTPVGMLVTNEKFCIDNEMNNSGAPCLETGNEEGCAGFLPYPPSTTTPIEDVTHTTETTEAPEDSNESAGITTDANGLVRLECKKEKGNHELDSMSVQWPVVQFDIIEKEGFEVDISVNAVLNATYGILWFSKVTTQYYKMEVNYNDYGLGCYGFLEYVTTVENLLPDTSYTFCVVLKGELTVSPFSCKSAYISGNLDVKYNAWLTTRMKATGISMVIIGIVLFMFFGILIVFLLIKRKPTLVKGSKRVAMQKNNSTNIIVYPEDKTLQKFQEKEEQIAKRNSRGSSLRRLSTVSNASMESNQSYMNPVNPNIYEMIPAYQRYLPTYSCDIGVDVSYAEIPFKRTSNDPLPEIPNSSNPSTSTLMVRHLATGGSSA